MVETKTLSEDHVINTGHVLKDDVGAILTLTTSTITGGTITDNGTIDVTGDSTIGRGAHLNGGNVTVEDGVLLTLDGITVDATTITDNDATLGTGAVQIDNTVKL